MWDGYESELVERSYNPPKENNMSKEFIIGGNKWQEGLDEMDKNVVLGGPGWQEALEKMNREKREKNTAEINGINRIKGMKNDPACPGTDFCDECPFECDSKELFEKVKEGYASTSYYVDMDFGLEKFMSELSNSDNISVVESGNPTKYYSEETVKQAYMAGIKYMQSVTSNSETTLHL